MNQTKHTQESEWEYIEDRFNCIIRVGNAYITAPYQPPLGRGVCPLQTADGHRIVNSVKACTGMTDPEKEVAELKAIKNGAAEFFDAVDALFAFERENPGDSTKAWDELFERASSVRSDLRAAIKNAGGKQ
jgi:hypothetical protein